MNRSLSTIWKDEFLVNGKYGVSVCGLCENQGIITTKMNRKFFCICPNGREIRRRSRVGTIRI